MKEYLNKDKIVITNDELIGEIYKNITINSPVKITERQKKIQNKIFEVATDYYFKLSHEISNFYQSQDDCNADVSIELHTFINKMFSLICILVAESGLADDDELKADLSDMERIYDDNFYKNCDLIITQFTQQFETLNEDFCHA